MSGCCDLPGCKRSQPILLRRYGPASEPVTVVLRYEQRAILFCHETHTVLAEDVLRVADEIRAAAENDAVDDGEPVEIQFIRAPRAREEPDADAAR